MVIAAQAHEIDNDEKDNIIVKPDPNICSVERIRIEFADNYDLQLSGNEIFKKTLIIKYERVNNGYYAIHADFTDKNGELEKDIRKFKAGEKGIPPKISELESDVLAALKAEPELAEIVDFMNRFE
ncbi:hypothetical protein HN924_01405 [Candidatus Woesearchaeota archaeon]|jgi:hypothetical protein|nr:hypothetical protein [Candidatus Woesearchaeota archaeon]MBT7402764.1 hypothetical protein [Candidatus Woesearchaeota archaeon]